jgi:hypothetical protein
VAKAVFHRLRSRLDVQFVLGNLPRDPLHVGGFPRKHVEVRFEEVDERAFLFRVERHPDTESTAIIADYRILDILGRLERAGRTLGRLGDILILGTRLSVEPRRPDGCFSELKALSIALVCALVRRPYCDDTPRSGDFQFQLRIIRHGHKLHVCRPPEDRMVRPREPHHFEGEGFCAKVSHVPECDGQIDLPEGSASIPGTTPWNGVIDGLSADCGMPISSSVDT